MTSNQIAYAQHKEQARKARVEEDLKERQFIEDKKTQKSQRFKNYTSPLRSVSAIKSLFGSKNDPAWYGRNPAAANAVGKLNVFIPRGAPMDTNGASVLTTEGKVGQKSALLPNEKAYFDAGIMVYRYCPVLPHANGEVSPTWIRSFQSMYMETRKANSGARNYTVENMAQWVLAAQSLLTLWSEGKRATEIINTYSTANRYYGRALAEAAGFDAVDLETNYSSWVTYLNLISTQINKTVTVPQIMPWFYRTIWLAGNVFADDDVNSNKCQNTRVNIAVPNGYYKYGDVEMFSKWINRDTTFTLRAFQAKMNTLLDAMLFSEDAGIIAGDIIKAFPNSSSVDLPIIESGAKLNIVFNELVNTQFANAVTVPFYHGIVPNLDITEVTNSDGSSRIIQNLGFQAINAQNIDKSQFNSAVGFASLYSDDWNPTECIEALMMTCVMDFENQGNAIKVTDCATEIITSREVVVYGTNSTGMDLRAEFYDANYIMKYTDTEYDTAFEAVYSIITNTSFAGYLLASKWRFAPVRYWYFTDFEDSGNQSKNMLKCIPLMDHFRYIAPVSIPSLQAIFNVATSSLLGLEA